MVTTAVVESPQQRQIHRSSSTLATVDGGGGGGGGDDDDFEKVRQLLRPAKQRSSGSIGGGMRGRRWSPPVIEISDDGVGGGGGMRGRRWSPPVIEVPDGVGGCGRYTSLSDIMASPEYAAGDAAAAMAKAARSPNEVGEPARRIRHPLVKHAAYAYLQLTPSAREAEARRRKLLLLQQRRRRPLCRIFLGCLGFLGALFGK